MQLRTVLIAVCFITGLLLTGSDGPLFPWINMAGVGVFLMVPVLAMGHGDV